MGSIGSQSDECTQNGRIKLESIRIGLELAAIVSMFGVATYAPFIRVLTQTQIACFILGILAIVLCVRYFLPRLHTVRGRRRLLNIILFSLSIIAIGAIYYRVVDVQFINKAPVIEGIVASQAEVRRGEKMTLEGRAWDPDGDSHRLDFRWDPDDGTIEGEGQAVTYKAPAHPTQRFIVIKLIVEDPKGKSTEKPFVVEVY